MPSSPDYLLPDSADVSRVLCWPVAAQFLGVKRRRNERRRQTALLGRNKATENLFFQYILSDVLCPIFFSLRPRALARAKGGERRPMAASRSPAEEDPRWDAAGTVLGPHILQSPILILMSSARPSIGQGMRPEMRSDMRRGE